MSERSHGIDSFTALFLVFLVLKLVGTIDWSWWWVTAPIWIPCAIFLPIIAIGCLLGGRR